MRSLIILLLAFPAHAQIVGWADCRHNAAGEKFGYIKVALMDGNFERKSSTRVFEGFKPGPNTVSFTAITGPAQFTGMRISCEIIVPPGRGVSSEETEYTVNWEKAILVATGVTFKPALTVTLQQMPDGWRASIGKAP